MALPLPMAIQQKRRRTVVGLLFLGGLISYIDRGNLSVAAVPLMQELQLSPPLMGTLMSAFFWSYSLMQIPAGLLIDRYGYKWTYAAGFVIWSLASAAVGLAHTFWQILVLRLLLGVGEAVTNPATFGYIKREFRTHEQGLPTSIYIAGITVGPALGALLGGALLVRLGWRGLFVTTGLLAMVWLIPWLRCAPSGSPTHGKRTVAEAGVASPPHNFWRDLLRSPLVWGLGVNTFFYSYFWYFCLSWLPAYLVMARGLSFLQMGAFVALPMLAMAGVATLSGRTADRLIARGKDPLLVRKAFVVTGTMTASTVVLLLLVRSPGSVLAVLFASLMGLGLAGGNYWSLTQAISPSRSIGKLVGFQSTIAQLAGVCAPMLTGFLIGNANRFGLAILVAALAPLLSAGAILLWIRRKDVVALNRAQGEESVDIPQEMPAA